jgi:hypothetical protein
MRRSALPVPIALGAAVWPRWCRSSLGSLIFGPDKSAGDGHPPAVGPVVQTAKSRRTLQIAAQAVEALRSRQARQDCDRESARELWHETSLVFTTSVGTEMDSHNVGRSTPDSQTTDQVEGTRPVRTWVSLAAGATADGIADVDCRCLGSADP